MEYQLYELEPYDDMPSAWMVLNEHDRFNCTSKDETDGIDNLLHCPEYSRGILDLLLNVNDFGDSEQATYLGMFGSIEELVQEIKMRYLLES